MPRQRRNQYLRMSDLLASGLKYFHFDRDSVFYFNDGTVLAWTWQECVTDAGTDLSDGQFECTRNGVRYNLVDDVGFLLDRRQFSRYPDNGGRSIFSGVDSVQQLENLIGVETGS